ncbi:MAG: sulfite exporter TauE/SafE family protein [Gammaproteobacteria bacterium]|nr:sulfite exporter TauE/SafE family protein [Gammaproteobacteria bacterium]MDH5776888.1 sulfite exporter TauE/SafE family protein [Gammaproteobacteria bacterium]
MDISISFIAVLIAGFLGGVHCVGMCGGIVGALSMGLPNEKRTHIRANFPYLILYNLGRILSYAIAGAIVAGLGALAIDLLSIRQAQLYLQLIAAVFMILLGLYLNGWWRILIRVEHVGSFIWQRLEPIGRKFLPIQHPVHAFILGMLWGWLPCGLVYSILIMTLMSGDALSGALLMFSFGIGTLPNLLAMGIFAAVIQKFVQQFWVQQIAGGLVIIFGLYTLWQAVESLS